MTSPVILLALGAVGWGAYEILGDRLAHFLGPVTGYVPPEPAVFSVSGIAALALVVAAIALAWAMYGRRPVPAVAPAARFPVTAARRDLYGDAFNESVLMRPGQWLTRLSVYFDNRGVDGLVNTIAAGVGGTSGRMRRIQTGFVRSYALSMFVGAVLLVGAFLLVRA
jgi:NADH-quinone oxidoreductase subunit L